MKLNDRVFEFKNNGFTLLEILIAVSILAIVVTVGFKAHSQAIVMNEEAKFDAIASALAQLRLAEFESKSDADKTEDSGDFGDEFPGYRWRVSVTDVDLPMQHEDADQMIRVDVTVSLRDDAFIYQLRAYMLNDGS